MISCLNSADLKLLAAYDFEQADNSYRATKLLGTKWNENHQWVLVYVDRVDVTCWQLFLSFFNYGKLAYTSVALEEVCQYLSTYNWKEIKKELPEDEQSEMYRAYKTACHVTNRFFLAYPGAGREWFKAISERIEGPFNHYWNPAMEGRFLLAIYRYLMPDAVGLELRFKETHASIRKDQKLTQAEVSQIEVGYRYEHTQEREERSHRDDKNEVIYHEHYHYPTFPYYQVEDTKYPPRRREI